MRRFETFTIHFEFYGYFINKDEISVRVARVVKE